MILTAASMDELTWEAIQTSGWWYTYMFIIAPNIDEDTNRSHLEEHMTHKMRIYPIEQLLTASLNAATWDHDR